MKYESGLCVVGPDRRDLMALVLAIVIGLSLGPMVLGRFAPRLYDYLFVGSGNALVDEVDEAVAEEIDEAIDADREKLVESGVSDQAVEEFDDHQKVLSDEAKEDSLATEQERKNARRHWFALRMHGMLLAVVVVMMLEVLTGWFKGVRSRMFRGRLIQGRYLVMSAWLVLFFAQPGMYVEVSPWFVVLLVLVMVAAGGVAIWQGRDAVEDVQ